MYGVFTYIYSSKNYPNVGIPRPYIEYLVVFVNRDKDSCFFFVGGG